MIALESPLNGLGFFFFFNKRQLKNYKLNNKTVSGCEFHRFFTFHNVTYSGFSTVCETAGVFVVLDANVVCQLFATILLKIKAPKNEYRMTGMADSFCIIDFSLKGLKSRLLSWLIFPQLLCSFTTSEQSSATRSHFLSKRAFLKESLSQPTKCSTQTFCGRV